MLFKSLQMFKICWGEFKNEKETISRGSFTIEQIEVYIKSVRRDWRFSEAKP